jgi:hypothetical protein
MGFKSKGAANRAFEDMLAAGEISPAEGEIEPYTIHLETDRKAKPARRWAITTPAS